MPNGIQSRWNPALSGWSPGVLSGMLTGPTLPPRMPPTTGTQPGQTQQRNLATDLMNNLWQQRPGETMGGLMQRQYQASPFASNEAQIALNMMRNYAPQYGLPQQTQGYQGFLSNLLNMVPQQGSNMGMYPYRPTAPGLGSLQYAMGMFGQPQGFRPPMGMNRPSVMPPVSKYRGQNPGMSTSMPTAPPTLNAQAMRQSRPMGLRQWLR